MKTSAEKSSTTTSVVHSQASNQPFFAKDSGGDHFFAPVTHTPASAVQMKMAVNQPGDKFEQEADKMSGKVMRLPTPAAPEKEEKLQRQADERLQKATQPEEKLQKAAAPEEKLQKQAEEKLQKTPSNEEKLQKAALPEEKIQKQGEEKLQKAPAAEEKVRRQADERLQKAEPEEKLQKQEKEKLQKAPDTEEKLQRRSTEGAPAVDAGVQSAIRTGLTGGQPLGSEVRSYMEPRFQADFSNVRVHSDPEAAKLSNRLSARAFTYQSHIFFSRDQYQPGTSAGKQLLAHELTHTIQQGHSVQRQPQVSTTITQPHIQRSAVGEILDWFADKANYIPGFRMFTIVLGLNPINMRSVDRSAANILRALIEFMPGASFITSALDNHGVFTKIAGWIETQIKALGMVGQMFKNALMDFIDSLGVSDLAPWNWDDLWDRAKRIFTAPIGRLIDFAIGVVSDIVKFIKDAILKPLAALAQGTRGYDLLCALLGEDPITGEPVPRTADTLIGGFMKLIGQEEIWENLKKGNAVARAWAWFQGALAGLLAFARAIPGRIISILTSLTIQDIVTVAGAFTKIVGAFANIAGEFYSWAFGQVISLLEILFSVVAPAVVPYLKKAQAAFQSILKNPIGFVGNLVRAGKLGFQMFAGNILLHLKTALIKWIVGPLAEAGVYIPKSFSLIEIGKLVLSVLGLTWQAIRAKLVKIIPDPVLAGLEKTASILVTLVKDGPVAAWEQIKNELSELKDQLIGQITQMISVEVVKAAVVKLVSMLNPAGAVIQAIIAIYNTITFFIEKIQQIAAVVAAFIDSIAAIAAGVVAAAAKKVEQTMANTLTVVLAFLAKFAGLGNIPKKVVGIINKIRKPIDKALDKIVAWLGNILKKLAGKVVQAGVPQDPNERLKLASRAAITAVRVLRGTITKPILLSALNVIKMRYGLTSIDPYVKRGTWWVSLSINPKEDHDSGKSEKTDISFLNKPRAVFRNTANKINTLWKKGATQKALNADPAQKATLTGEKNAIDIGLDAANQPEKDFLKYRDGYKETEPPVLTTGELLEDFEVLAERATELFEKLSDFVKTPEERAAEITKLRKQIAAARDRAAAVMVSPQVIAVLALSIYEGLKNDITNGLADVQARIAADTAVPKTLEALRADWQVANTLRQNADRADKLANIAKSVEPFIKTIDDIITNTTKAGREDANVGDGSSEAAAIEEARTGLQIKGAWHGPKCQMEAAGLDKAIKALEELLPLAADPALQAEINDAIARAEARKKGLDSGWQAWKASPHHHLKPLS
jgi:hypothetical protein